MFMLWMFIFWNKTMRKSGSLSNEDLVVASLNHYDHLDRTSIVKIFNRWNNVKFAPIDVSFLPIGSNIIRLDSHKKTVSPSFSAIK